MRNEPIRQTIGLIVLFFVLAGVALILYQNNATEQITQLNQQVSGFIRVDESLTTIELKSLQMALGDQGVAAEIEVLSQELHNRQQAMLERGLLSALGGRYEQDFLQWNAEVTNVVNTASSESTLLSTATFRERIESLREINEARKQVFIREIRGVSTQNNRVTNLLTGVLLVSAAFLVIYVRSNVLKPLKTIIHHFHHRNLEGTNNQDLINLESNSEIGYLVKEYNELTERSAYLSELNEQIYGMHDLDEVLRYIFDNFRQIVDYSRIAFAVVSEVEDRVVAQNAISDGVMVLEKNYEEKLSGTSIGQLLYSNELRIIGDLEDYLMENPGSSSTTKIVAEGMKSSLTIPLVVDHKPVGVIFFSSRHKHAFQERHIQMLRSVVNSIAVAFENSFRRSELILGTIKGFATIVEAKDMVTGDHVDRMSQYSRTLAGYLQTKGLYPDIIDERYLDDIEKFSPLHDIGKVNIPDSILNKPGKLTAEEFDIMKTHASAGHIIMDSIGRYQSFMRDDHFSMAKDIIRHHHERVDGSGYPDGLAGDKIPLSARIVAVADVFDALVSERPYKRAFTFEEAMDIINDSKGTHLDADIVNVLMERQEDFKSCHMHVTTGHSLVQIKELF